MVLPSILLLTLPAFAVGDTEVEGEVEVEFDADLPTCVGGYRPLFDARPRYATEDELDQYMASTWSDAPSAILCEKRACNAWGQVNEEDEPLHTWYPTSFDECFQCDPKSHNEVRALNVDTGKCVKLGCGDNYMYTETTSGSDSMTDPVYHRKRFDLFDQYIGHSANGNCPVWHCEDMTRSACVEQCGRSRYGRKSLLIGNWHNNEGGDCCWCNTECDPESYEEEVYVAYPNEVKPCKLRFCGAAGYVKYVRVECTIDSDGNVVTTTTAHDTVTDTYTGSDTTTVTTNDASSTTSGADDSATSTTTTLSSTTAPSTPNDDGSDDGLVLVDGETNLIVLPGDRTLVIVAFHADDTGADCDLREAEVRALVSNPVTLGRCEGLIDKVTGQCSSLTCECRVPEDQCRSDAAGALQSWSAVESVGLIAETEYQGTAQRWTGPTLAVLCVAATAAMLW